MTPVLKATLGLLVAPAIYGFSIGIVRSEQAALLNTVKFPLLILISVGIASVAYFVVGRFLVSSLSATVVRRLVIAGYAELSVMLASLSPICLFCALVFERPRSLDSLGEYPSFLRFNLLLIAASGCVALGRQATKLLDEHAVGPMRAALVVSLWLGLSLVVGGQAAWYLRPFFGNAAVPESARFCLGSAPDFRGATSFYEAVADLAYDACHANHGRARPGR